jgi:uncharacterized protein YbaP (TraB family)
MILGTLVAISKSTSAPNSGLRFFMNKKCYFLVLIFVFGFNTYASPLKNPYLYEVRKDNKISYMLGSIHIGFSVSDLPSWVNELHKRAKIHSYEVDMGGGDNIDYFKFTQNLFLDPDAESVKNYLLRSKEEGLPLTSSEIEKLIEIGFPRTLVETMTDKTDCSLLFLYDNVFTSVYKSIDFEFYNNSLLMGKKIVPLENEEIREKAEELIEFEEECLITDFIWVEDILNEIRKYNAEDGSLEHYLEGFESTQYPEKSELDLFYRNKKWIPVLKEMFDEGNAFVVFGVAHLFDEEGVISLLKKEGYQVNRVTKNPLEGLEAIPPSLRPYR